MGIKQKSTLLRIMFSFPIFPAFHHIVQMCQPCRRSLHSASFLPCEFLRKVFEDCPILSSSDHPVMQHQSSNAIFAPFPMLSQSPLVARSNFIAALLLLLLFLLAAPVISHAGNSRLFPTLRIMSPMSNTHLLPPVIAHVAVEASVFKHHDATYSTPFSVHRSHSILTRLSGNV